jgi:GT2 family glycosyltransferase
MFNMPIFCTVIRHHNSYDLTTNCVKSLENIKLNSQIFIIEDGSTDGSEKKIKTLKSKVPIKIISTKGVHLEYCRALNLGIKHALKENFKYIFVVNTDTKNFSTNYFEVALKDFEKDPSIGKWGSKVYDYDGKRRGGGEVMHKLGINLTTPTEGYILNSKALDQIGLFDEKLYRYFEDLDLIIRLRSSGYSIFCNMTVSFDHLGGGLSGNYPYIRNYYRVRNVIWFIKHYKPGNIYNRLHYIGSYIKGSLIRLLNSIKNGEIKRSAVLFYSVVKGITIGTLTKWK